MAAWGSDMVDKTVSSLFLNNQEEIDKFVSNVSDILFRRDPLKLDVLKENSYDCEAQQFVDMLLDCPATDCHITELDTNIVCNIIYSSFVISTGIMYDEEGNVDFMTPEELLEELGPKSNYIEIAKEIVSRLVIITASMSKIVFAEQDKINQGHIQTFITLILDALDVEPMFLSDKSTISDFRPSCCISDFQKDEWYDSISKKIGINIVKEGENFIWKIAEEMYKKSFS